MKCVIFAVVAVVWLSGCTSTSVVDPSVADVVERLGTAPTPQRWQFTYRADNASPFVSCLDGIDEVTATVDVDAGLMLLQPNRAASPIIVTTSSFLVPVGTDLNGAWHEVARSPGDETELMSVFGEVLAGYMASGLRTPDPNMIGLAAVEIADDISPTAPQGGLSGDTFAVTLDPGRYLAELEDEGEVAEDDELRVPLVTVAVDGFGRVVGLVVDATSGIGEEAFRDRYLIDVSYDPLSVDVPDAALRRPARLGDINYPSPAESCQFGS